MADEPRSRKGLGLPPDRPVAVELDVKTSIPLMELPNRGGRISQDRARLARLERDA